MNEGDLVKALSVLGETVRILAEDIKVHEANTFALLDSLKNWILAETEVNGRKIEDELDRLNEMHSKALDQYLARVADQDHNLSEKIRKRITCPV